MRTTSQTQPPQTTNEYRINLQVIVQLGEGASSIDDLVKKWKKDLNDNSLDTIDSSDCHRELHLLECKDKHTALALIKEVDIESTTGISIGINGRHDEGAPDLEIDSDGIFNEKMRPPIVNDNSFDENLPNAAFEDEVTIYLLDTGANIDLLNTREVTKRHLPEFMVAQAPKYDESEIYPGPGYSYLPPHDVSNDIKDENGHGTFGIEVITRGMPADKIKVIPLKIFNKDGKGTFFNMICAMYHAIDHGADIINLSAGFRESIKYIPPILQDVIKEAARKGVFIVVSAGNGIKNTDTGIDIDSSLKEIWLPTASKSPNMISVASLDFEKKSRSTFSNYGKNSVSVATYGENIPIYGEPVLQQSGTSVATFYTTKALAAVISKNKGQSVESIRNKFDYLLQDCPTGIEETAQKCLFFDKFLEKLEEDTYSEAAIMI